MNSKSNRKHRPCRIDITQIVDEFLYDKESSAELLIAIFQQRTLIDLHFPLDPASWFLIVS